MKIQNNSPEFELTFDGHDIVVPTGLSDEFPDKVAYFVQEIAIKWGKSVRLISNAKEEATLKAEQEAPKVTPEVAKEVEKEVEKEKFSKTK